MKSLKVILVHPAADAKVLIVDATNTLESLQALVGGMIEGISVVAGVDGYINEEGKILGMPPNVKIPYDMICGPIVFTRTDDEGETVSVEDGDLEKVQKWLDASNRPRLSLL